MYAAISPRDRAVALLRDEDGDVQVLDRAGSPVRSMSAERYLSLHPDTLVVDVRDEKHAVDALAQRTTMSMCLDMTLLLFDSDVSIQTREELARELNSLFQETPNRNYVLDIILCRPLPPIADVAGAAVAVENSGITQEIVAAILDCQDRVRLIFETWLRIKQEPIVQQNDSGRVHALFSQYGVFRRLAMNAADKDELKALKSTIVMDATLQNQLDVAPRILISLVKELGQQLPDGKNNRATSIAHADGEVRPSSASKYDDSKPQHTSAHSAYNAAMSQVERIVELFANSKDKQGESFLKQLTAEQLKHPNGEQYIVRSLCNVATKVRSRGRRDISLECLKKALEYPNGIDSQLYLQIAVGLRGLKQFDEAVNCLIRAEILDNGSLSERILLERIQVRKARGDYKEACADYLALIPSLTDKAPAFSELGTLYRKMGRRREAREKYRSCLQIDKKFHSALAGLAELRKQTGKPHRAIAEYNALINQFPNLDDGAKKVYQLARSHLFRLTEQYDKSESVLRDLADFFPADRDVHLQFAKLLALQDKHKEAREHFEKAKGPSLQDLGQLIFAKASKQFDSAIVRDGIVNIHNSLMPEDKGLGSCIEAYDRITTSEFDRAQQVLFGATFVDRLVGDFSNVLRFHALRKATGSFDYKSDHSLCRVAKRSDHGLRFAMQEIASGHYDNATSLEGDFLLRIVA